MKKENKDYLNKKFPYLYGYIRFFECDDGWFEIIYNLSEKIHEIDPHVQATQVKEKFGGLRFYTNYGNEEINKVIREAESASLKTCEVCGTKENVTQKSIGWVKTLCDKCRECRDKENVEFNEKFMRNYLKT